MFDLMVGTVEDKSDRIDRKIEAMEGELENLSRLQDDLFRETKLSVAEVRAYLTDRENFTAEGWKKIEEERVNMKEKLAREMENVGDQRGVERKLRERKKIDPRWLYVR